MTDFVQYLSAPELAALALDGLPGSRRRIDALAARDGWAHVQRLGRGGGRLFAIADLPERARRDLEARRAAVMPCVERRRPGRPSGTDFFTYHPEIADAVEALIASQKRAAPRVLELLAQKFATLPHIATLRRFIRRIEEEKPALLASMRDPDLFKSRYRVSIGRADGGVSRAHEVWELDTTAADVLTVDGRMMILGVIDRWSRRARFLVAPSESAQSVRRLLIDTIRGWGVLPETVVTDRGSGFINASIASALETLGIAHRPCPPASGDRKPFVERLFGTFTRERAELLEGYSGHNVAEAQKLRARARDRTGRAVITAGMTAQALQDVLSSWVEGVYHLRTHSALRTSPMRKWQSSPVPAATAPAENVLRIALSALVGAHLVGKRGVQWKSGRYWSAALAPYVGRRVIVRRDEDDLGALFIFDEDGLFIDAAVNAERAGLSEEAFARAARTQQNAWMKDARADLRRKQRAFRFEDARDAVLRDDAVRAAKVTALPQATRRRSTPAIDSIAIAPQPPVPSEAAVRDALRRSAPAKPANRAESPADRVARADRIIAAASHGASVDAHALEIARIYATSSEYRAEKLLAAHFGGSALPAAARASGGR